MAHETSIYREVIQKKLKRYEISVHLQKYRGEDLPKGKFNDHQLSDESLENVLCQK